MQYPEAKLTTTFDALVKDALEHASNSKSESTRRAYALDWANFRDWASEQEKSPIPANPETIAAYIAHLARTKKMSTIDRAIVAINQAHQLSGYESPTANAIVRETRRGFRREKGTAQKKSDALKAHHIRLIINLMKDTPVDIRDRSLLSLCWLGAFRRSEIVSIDKSDIVDTEQGIIITLNRSKTDQEGKGEQIAIPFGVKFCAIRFLAEWLDLADIEEGPIFKGLFKNGKTRKGRLSARTVDKIVRTRAKDTGLVGNFSAHSLRAGFITSAVEQGRTEAAIMSHTRHHSAKIMRGYVRTGSLFISNPATALL